MPRRRIRPVRLRPRCEFLPRPLGRQVVEGSFRRMEMTDMTIFSGKGNLAASPNLKHVQGKNGDFTVAEMRVYFGRHKRNEQTGEFDQVGGFWLPVSIYGNKAEAVAQHLRKGARVQVTGELKEYTGKDENGVEHELFQVDAEDVSLVLSRVSSVTFAQREERQPEPADASY